MIVFVADLFQEDYIGGGELTTEAIIQGCLLPIKKIRSTQLTKAFLNSHQHCFWVFGNFSGIPDDTLLFISQNLDYCVIEYDYKFCSYRSPEKHAAANGNKCDCRDSDHGKIVSIFMASAKNLWFMSEGQKEYYCNLYSFLDRPSTKVLSSVFDEWTLDYIESAESNRERRDVWLIQDSNSWIKGTQESIEYAEKNNLKYELFSSLSYRDMLKKFSTSKGFISLPRGMDTCPRTFIEAKLMGCETVGNENIQHREETWFSGSKREILGYLRSRPFEFWSETLKNSNISIPKKSDEKYRNKIHFKIIVPVYNSESWIANTIKSIEEQEYENYECIICDDISSDNTPGVCRESISKNDKIRVLTNTEKKFALKNIYDSINILSPSDEDVILVLDGDDWLSTPYVLSNLSRYYTDEGCWMTYGSFVEYPTGHVGAESSGYSTEVIEGNSFRQDKWRASHLKTFKHFLWRSIDKGDFLDDDGQFYEMTYDQATMLPMLEMSGHRSKYIKEVNYVYNISNPNAVNKTRARKQHNLMLKIRSKNKYKRLKR
jgi:hypothetical protein